MSGKAVLLVLEQAGIGGLSIPETSQQWTTKLLFIRRSCLFPRLVWVGSNLKYPVLAGMPFTTPDCSDPL